MSTPRVTRINVTPVKSMRLHHPESVELGPDGARDDRRFLLVDDAARLYNGKRDTSLVRAAAVWEAESRQLTVTLPSGESLEGEAVRGRPAVVTVYGREVRGHVVDGPWADGLSDLVGRSLALVEREDGAWATDSRPATLVSQSSTAVIDGDGRRFRMLLELEGVDTLGEEAWRGRHVRVGEATLLVGEPTPRCAVPSASPDTGRRDRDVVRELIDARGATADGEACLGVYADVARAGRRSRRGRADAPLAQPGFRQIQIWSSPPS